MIFFENNDLIFPKFSTMDYDRIKFCLSEKFNADKIVNLADIHSLNIIKFKRRPYEFSITLTTSRWGSLIWPNTCRYTELFVDIRKYKNGIATRFGIHIEKIEYHWFMRILKDIDSEGYHAGNQYSCPWGYKWELFTINVKENGVKLFRLFDTERQRIFLNKKTVKNLIKSYFEFENIISAFENKKTN